MVLRYTATYMLQQKIRTDMMSAMKEKDQVKLDTLRGLIAGFTNELVANKMPPTAPVPDEMVLAVIRREVKKRKEATEAFKTGGREESANKEIAERMILEAYLPAMMSEEDVRAIVLKRKEDLGVTDKKNAGILMGRVMKELAGKADGGMVKAIVDSLFS